jgi:GTP cyclohydrolase I
MVKKEHESVTDAGVPVAGPGVVRSVPNKPDVASVVYEAEVAAVCSVGLAPFQGVAEIAYEPADKLLEFESFEDWLREISDTKTTIEGLARMIADKVRDVVAVRVSVRLSATTQVHGPVEVVAVAHPESDIKIQMYEQPKNYRH